MSFIRLEPHTNLQDEITLSDRLIYFGKIQPSATRLHIDYDSKARSIRFSPAKSSSNALKVYCVRGHYHINAYAFMGSGVLPKGRYARVSHGNAKSVTYKKLSETNA